MRIYSIPTLIGSIFVLFIGLFVFVRNYKSAINKSFFGLTVFLFVWLFSYTITYSTESKLVAYIFCRVACTSVMFTTSAIYLFVALYLKKFETEKRWIYLSFGFMIALFPFFIFTKKFLDDPYLYPWGYYSKAGMFHPFYLVPFFAIWVKGLFMFFDKKMWSELSNFGKNRLNYILAMYFLATLGSIDYIQKYGINFYPFGWIFEVLFAVIIAYAIVKYRIMDVSLALTRSGIFVFVYTFVLGIPFIFAFGWQQQLRHLIGENWWIIPLVSSTVLATAGPFIYLFIQKRAEDRLMQEQRRYQMTLRQASSGMSRIKDLKKLLNLIVRIVNRTVNLEHTSVYLYNQIEKKFILEAMRNREPGAKNGMIDSDAPIVHYLRKEKEPVVYDEVKQRTQDYTDPELSKVEEDLRNLDAAVAIPSLIEDKLLGILVLGRKRSGKLFSGDDLAVFSILANQAALAIENAMFYEDAQKTQEQLFQAEKMATIGTMADGLSHQINNRLHALGFISGDALDTIKLKSSIQMTPEIKELIDEITRSLERIQENVKQGGEIVQGLLRYTRKGEAGLSPVDLPALMKASFEMASYKVKLEQLTIVEDYPKDLPKILGNFTQLQEVFFNIIDNAYDAIMQKKAEGNDPNFKGKLQISARKKDETIEISVVDNGIGVKDDDQNKLFTPFFTTKVSSKKGTGLGLYVIKKIIEENHHGQVAMSSDFMTGTLITIRVPAAG